jgi:hypothetical protein
LCERLPAPRHLHEQIAMAKDVGAVYYLQHGARIDTAASRHLKTPTDPDKL